MEKNNLCGERSGSRKLDKVYIGNTCRGGVLGRGQYAKAH